MNLPIDIFSLRMMRVRPHNLPVPSRAKENDSGLDLSLDLSDSPRWQPGELLSPLVGSAWRVRDGEGKRGLCFRSGTIIAVDTGWAIELPPGYEGLTRGRSGLAFNRGIFVALYGTIDAGYRGEIRVLIENRSGIDQMLYHGDRIAQLVIGTVPQRIVPLEVHELGSSDRGVKGFGSSGV